MNKKEVANKKVGAISEEINSSNVREASRGAVFISTADLHLLDVPCTLSQQSLLDCFLTDVHRIRKHWIL